MHSKFLIILNLFSLLTLNKISAQTSQDIPPANGLSADRPVLLFEKNGVFSHPWGAAGNAWPQQLFWNNVSANNNQHLQEMINEAEGIESAGRVPVLGSVAWGYEYISATGGDTSNLAAFPDLSEEGGWKQWGEWMADSAHTKYYSTNWDGKVEPGYVTPLMPMDTADWPSEWKAPSNWIAPQSWINNKPVASLSYAQWLGNRLSQLALKTACRGIYCADYVIGLEWGDAIDYNPRVVDDFAKWASISIPEGTVSERADFIQMNCKSLWFDFKCVRFAEFYCSMGQNLLDNGKIPLIGGQTLGENRGSGNDFRIYTHGINGSTTLPGKYWFFNVELQADDLRPPHEYWESSGRMGLIACREPDMRLGAQMNAKGGQGMFDKSVKMAKHDSIWGSKSLANQWLSVGWTHIAGRDGVVRRAPMSFMRSYWDAGETPQPEFNLLLQHIPRHPFGPAVYYSVAIERAFEKENGKYSNSWYMCSEKFLRELRPIQNGTHQGYFRGLSSGYWVSDVGIDSLKPVDYPAAWIVYDSKYLPSNERTKLESIAPIIDPEENFSSSASSLFSLGPVHIEQNDDQCVNCLAFVDQNESVIVMISNSMETDVDGTLQLTNVGNGNFSCNGLLNCEDTNFTVSENSASLSISVPARGTMVYEIPKLKWLGHEVSSPVVTQVVEVNHQINIYPNPNYGNFILEYPNFADKAEISVYNTLGLTVYKSLNQGLHSIEIKLPSQAKGIYFVKVVNGKNQFIKKMVVK